MPYVTQPVPSFSKGLNLRDHGDVIDPAEALDLLNVTFTERGGVKSRDGYARLSTTTLTNQPDSVFPFYTSGGAKRLLVGNGNRVDAYDSFPGVSVASTGLLATTAFPHFFTRFGGPVREAAYIANGADPIKRYDIATSFSIPATMDEGAVATVIAPKFLSNFDTRLVGARFVGTTAQSNPSTVRFSRQGDPETWDSTEYVQLDPGDGEAITGIASWRELLFVFKETKFYVFFGVGTNAVGGPTFHFRRVDTGVGAVAPKAIATARDGVYFLHRDGVYRTAGQEPEQVSDIIDPFFIGNPAPTFLSSAINRSQIQNAAMCYHQERIYVALPTGSSAVNDRVLVHDPRYGWWSLYDFPAAGLCSFRPVNIDELVFACSEATAPNDVGKHICTHGPSHSADNQDPGATGGAAIETRWRSGWGDFGDPNVKRVRETRIWAEGTASFRLTFDFRDTGIDTLLRFGRGASDLWAGDGIVIIPPIDGTTDTWGDGSGPDTWGGGSNPEDIWNDGTVGTGTPGSEIVTPDDSGDTWGDGTTDADLWGPSRQVIPRLLRQARRGTVFSMKISNSTINQSWVIHRMDHHLADQRFPNTPRSEVAT